MSVASAFQNLLRVLAAIVVLPLAVAVAAIALAVVLLGVGVGVGLLWVLLLFFLFMLWILMAIVGFLVGAILSLFTWPFGFELIEPVLTGISCVFSFLIWIAAFGPVWGMELSC